MPVARTGTRPTRTVRHLLPDPAAFDVPEPPGVTRELGDLARGLAATPEVWASRVRHDPSRRFYERVVVTDTYDAWLIGWSPGQAIPAHDHGSSAGAIVLTEGQLTETSWPRSADTPSTSAHVDVR